MTPDDKKLIRGFMFLSEKPILYVLNISRNHNTRKRPRKRGSEIQTHAKSLRAPNAGATAICGKVEAELSEMSDADAAEFLSSYGLKESGLPRG